MSLCVVVGQVYKNNPEKIRTWLDPILTITKVGGDCFQCREKESSGWWSKDLLEDWYILVEEK